MVEAMQLDIFKMVMENLNLLIFVDRKSTRLNSSHLE